MQRSYSVVVVVQCSTTAIETNDIFLERGRGSDRKKLSKRKMEIAEKHQSQYYELHYYHKRPMLPSWYSEWESKRFLLIAQQSLQFWAHFEDVFDILKKAIIKQQAYALMPFNCYWWILVRKKNHLWWREIKKHSDDKDKFPLT